MNVGTPRATTDSTICGATEIGEGKCCPTLSAGERLGPYLLGGAVYWGTLAARITAIGCHPVVSDGPRVPDEGATAGLEPTTVRHDA